MKLKPSLLILCTLCAGAAAFAADATMPRGAAPVIIQRGSAHLEIAQTHAEICKANLDQCLKGCDGFAQCSNQCQKNYQGCMSQNGFVALTHARPIQLN